MNLGYLMIPHDSGAGQHSHDGGRAEMARDLGVSEFYAVGQHGPYHCVKDANRSPEKAVVLQAMANASEKPILQIATIKGRRQPALHCAAKGITTRPSVSPEQVAANARQHQATLSVSWLNKFDLAKHWSANVAGSTHAGVRARPENWRVARTILVGSDPARVQAAVTAQDSPCRAYYSKIAGADASAADVDALMASCVLAGGLQSVLEELHNISTTSAPFGTLTLVDHAWPDVELANRSLATIADALTPVISRNHAWN